jgi:hypothetical protein
MLRYVALTLMLTTPALAVTYTVDSIRDGLAKIPCKAWTHNATTHTWHTNASIMVGGTEWQHPTFGPGSEEDKILTAKCGS